MSMRSAEASSKTYRKATNLLAEELDIEPSQKDRPSDDYKNHVEIVGEKLRERAEKYYRIGVRRGFINACDRILGGDLNLEDDGTLTLFDERIEIRVRIRYAPDDDKRPQKLTFKPSELEFD